MRVHVEDAGQDVLVILEVDDLRTSRLIRGDGSIDRDETSAHDEHALVAVKSHPPRMTKHKEMWQCGRMPIREAENVTK